MHYPLLHNFIVLYKKKYLNRVIFYHYEQWQLYRALHMYVLVGDTFCRGVINRKGQGGIHL